MADNQDYYVLLGIFRDATREEIKKAYLKAAQRLHPDKNEAPGETEMFLDVQKAYDTLSDAAQRAKYDATLPDENEHLSPIVQRISYSRSNLVRLDETQLVYALLEWKPRQQKDKVLSPPLNVCLVLDRSTSMRHEKMDMVKAAALHLLRGLREQDIFSVVTFSDHAEVVIPASVQMDRLRMESKIHQMIPSGATELFKGLQAGVKEVRKHLAKERVNHVVLLTDGHTYGDEEKCLQLAEEATESGIGISGLGIGKDWNDLFLDELAGKTGSSSIYIAEPREIQRFLEEKFAELTKVFAENVTLTFEQGEGIDLKYAFRLHPNSGPVSVSSPMQLGVILQDTPLSILLEFVVYPSVLMEDVANLLQGMMKFSIPMKPLPPQPLRVRLYRPVLEAASSEPPPVFIIQALANLNFYRLQEKARADVDAGNEDVASRRLHFLATNLLDRGEKKLAQTVLLEAEHLQRMNSLSKDGYKNIKYGTRALLLPSQKGESL